MQAGPGFTPLSQTDREGSVDERSDSAMLETRPSRPLIQDPSGAYVYGSGAYLVPVFVVLCPCCCSTLAPLLVVVSPRLRLNLCSAWILMQPLYYELDPLMHNGTFTAFPKPAAQ